MQHEYLTPTIERNLDFLTPREQQIMAVLARGLVNSAIAATLTLTPKSVEHGITHIYSKMGFSNKDAGFNPRVQSLLAYQKHVPDFHNPIEHYFDTHEVIPLSRRQQQVVYLIGQGYSNIYISDTLHLTHKTVENYIRIILDEKIPVNTQRYSTRVILALVSQTQYAAKT